MTRAAAPGASPSTFSVSFSYFSLCNSANKIRYLHVSLKKISIFVSVAVREGSDGDCKKVDPRCPNAPNPFHVCTDHCLTKMAEAGRSSEGGKSPISLFSRHSRRSSSSSGGSCFITCNVSLPPTGWRLRQLEEQLIGPVQYQLILFLWLLVAAEGSVTSGGSRKVDPKCSNAANPFHEYGEYCAAKMQ